jgi:hypothetical protein
MKQQMRYLPKSYNRNVFRIRQNSAWRGEIAGKLETESVKKLRLLKLQLKKVKEQLEIIEKRTINENRTNPSSSK